MQHNKRRHLIGNKRQHMAEGKRRRALDGYVQTALGILTTGISALGSVNVGRLHELAAHEYDSKDRRDVQRPRYIANAYRAELKGQQPCSVCGKGLAADEAFMHPKCMDGRST